MTTMIVMVCMPCMSGRMVIMIARRLRVLHTLMPVHRRRCQFGLHLIGALLRALRRVVMCCMRRMRPIMYRMLLMVDVIFSLHIYASLPLRDIPDDSTLRSTVQCMPRFFLQQ
jgi:hypothetical protein